MSSHQHPAWFHPYYYHPFSISPCVKRAESRVLCVSAVSAIPGEVWVPALPGRGLKAGLGIPLPPLTGGYKQEAVLKPRGALGSAEECAALL